MKIKRILYIGEDSGNSLSRLNAMKRLGYEVDTITPRKFLPKSNIIDRIMWKFSSLFFIPIINKGIKNKLKGKHTYDLIWVNAGDYLFPSSVKILKKYSKNIINYTTDDPFGGRDGARHLGYKKSINLYNLIVVVRKPNIKEAYDLGAKKVMFTYMTADEVDHKKYNLTDKDIKELASEVLFLGTWFPERGPFMLKLIKEGVPLTIIGPRWEKSKEWLDLKPYYRGSGLYGGDYAKAIQSSKICLGLLSKGNRDEHTTRSMEIPALGSLLCAERTNEHEALYKDGVEAVFWENAEECALRCNELLNNNNLLNEIKNNGFIKVHKNKSFNEFMINKIIQHIQLINKKVEQND